MSSLHSLLVIVLLVPIGTSSSGRSKVATTRWPLNSGQRLSWKAIIYANPTYFKGVSTRCVHAVHRVSEKCERAAENVWGDDYSQPLIACCSAWLQIDCVGETAERSCSIADQDILWNAVEALLINHPNKYCPDVNKFNYYSDVCSDYDSDDDSAAGRLTKSSVLLVVTTIVWLVLK